MDHYVLVKNVVEWIYTSGASARAIKGGHQETLVKSIIDNGDSNKPMCVGIWSMIQPCIRDLIRDKAQAKKLSIEDQKSVVALMLSFHGTYSDTYFCYIPRVARLELEAFMLDHESTRKKILENALNFRSIFVDQERQKMN